MAIDTTKLIALYKSGDQEGVRKLIQKTFSQELSEEENENLRAEAIFSLICAEADILEITAERLQDIEKAYATEIQKSKKRQKEAPSSSEHL